MERTEGHQRSKQRFACFDAYEATLTLTPIHPPSVQALCHCKEGLIVVLVLVLELLLLLLLPGPASFSFS